MPKIAKKVYDEVEATKFYPTPLEASAEAAPLGLGQTRRNAASTIQTNDKYKNILDGLVPFRYSNTTYNRSGIDIRDAVDLTMRCYYNFAQFRNVIDTMTEFSISKIYFKGTNKKAINFFEAFFNKINLQAFQDRFFREYYRSGNVFIYRFETKLKQDDINKITQVFGGSSTILPSRYVILNPADIQLSGGSAFVYGRFYKVLTDYEVEALRNPRTPEDKEIFDSLPKTAQDIIKNRRTNIVLIELDPKKLYGVFYKKQDYEPFSVPMGFPVLEDINWKYEMKKMDMAIARTMQQAILLITMGAKPDDGGVNYKNIEAMQKIFLNQSVGRVLVADFTTKAEFVIPQIADILDPKKYEVVDRDIQLGLNNILVGEDKFANQSIKVKIFIEKLKKGREAFIDNFLFPEIRRISDEMGFKSYVTPVFEDIDIEDGLEFSKMVTQLINIGVLTPDEGIESIQSGKFPTPEDSVESQQKFRALKNKGLYQPVIGGAYDQLQVAKEAGSQKMQVMQTKQSGPNGRPAGTKAPQTTKKMTPIGGEQLYSLKKVTDNLILAQNLNSLVEKKLLKKFKLEQLSDEQKLIASNITELIIVNELPENWNDKAMDYVKDPADKNLERIKEVEGIALEHQLDNYLAGILLASKK